MQERGSTLQRQTDISHSLDIVHIPNIFQLGLLKYIQNHVNNYSEIKLLCKQGLYIRPKWLCLLWFLSFLAEFITMCALISSCSLHPMNFSGRTTEFRAKFTYFSMYQPWLGHSRECDANFRRWYRKPELRWIEAFFHGITSLFINEQSAPQNSMKTCFIIWKIYIYVLYSWRRFKTYSTKHLLQK